MILFVTGLVALIPMVVYASLITQDISNGIYDVLAAMVIGILKFFGGFIILAMKLVQWAFTINQFKNISVVLTGWHISLGLVNVFFGLGLLVIAFSTVLGLDGYGMKKTLPKLIIIALLVNFSLVVCGIIIDFSQVLTLYFLAPTGIQDNNFGTAIAQGLSLPLIYSPTHQALSSGDIAKMSTEDIQKTFAKEGHPNWSNLLIVLFAGIAIELVAALTLAAAAFFLVVRLIILWALIIVVPLAWFFWIFPETQSYCSDWWKNFLKWVTFAPVYAFFFYLACLIVDQGVITKLAGGVPSSSITATIDGSTGAIMGPILSSSVKVLQYILVIGFLLGGLIFAEKGGVYGAKGFIGIARGASNFTKERAKRIGHWAHRKTVAPVANKLAEKAADIETEQFRWRHPIRTAQIGKRLRQKAFLSGSGILAPKQSKEAYKQWLEGEEGKVYPKTQGSIYDAMKNIYSKEVSRQGEISVQSGIFSALEKEKKRTYDAGELIHDFETSILNKDWRTMAGTALYLTSMNNLQDLILKNGDLQEEFFRQEKPKLVEYYKNQGLTEKEAINKAEQERYNSKIAKDFLIYSFKKAGTKDKEIGEVLAQISDTAFASKNASLIGLSEYNDKLGYKGVVSDEKRLKIASGLLKGLEGRKLISQIHPESIYSRNSQGEFIGLSNMGRFILKDIISSEWEREFHRARTDFKRATIKSSNSLIAFAQELEKDGTSESIKQAKLIRGLVKRAIAGKNSQTNKSNENKKGKSSIIDTDLSDAHLNDLKNNYQGK